MTGSTKNNLLRALPIALLIAMLATPALAQQDGGVDHASAIAQLPETDQRRFGEALGLAQVSFEQGDFERAIAQLTEAYGIYPLPRILYKLAEAQERAGKLEAARKNYQSYLDAGDVSEERATIQGLISNLDRRLSEPAMLVLTSTPDGALVYLEGQPEPIGATPLRYPLTPGTYTLRLEADSHEPNTFTLDAKYGAELIMDKKLERIAPLPVDPIKAMPDMPRLPPLARPLGLVSAGLGITSGALLLWANAQANTLEDSYTNRDVTTRPEDLDQVTSRHNTLIVSAWVMGALSVAGSSWSVLRWRKEPRSITLDADAQGATLKMELKF